LVLLRRPSRLTHRSCVPLQAAEQRQRFREPLLLFDACESCVEVDKQVAQREQVHLHRSRIDSLAESVNHLFRHKTVKIPDRREMGIGIATSKLNRSGYTMQEGLERIVRVGGFRTWHPGAGSYHSHLGGSTRGLLPNDSQRTDPGCFFNFSLSALGSVVQ